MVIDASEVLSVIKKPGGKQSAGAKKHPDSASQPEQLGTATDQNPNQVGGGETNAPAKESGKANKSSERRGRGPRKGRKK